MQTKSVDGLIKKVRAIVKGIRKSAKARTMLCAQQRALGLPETALVMDVITRWNRCSLCLCCLLSLCSTYDMLNAYYSNHTVLDIIVPRLRSSTKVRGFQGDKGQPLTAEETGMVGQLIRLLRPCKNVTTVLQGKKYVTASMGGPLVRTCGAQASAVLSELPADSPVAPVAFALANAIDTRFKQTHKHEIIAMMLDPRFKQPIDDYLAPAWEELGKHFGLEKQLVEYERIQAEQKAAEAQVKAADKEKAEKKTKAKDTDGKAPKQEKLSVSASSTAATTTFEPAVEDIVAIFGLGRMETEKPKRAPEQEMMDYLLNEPVLGIREDPLVWWRANKHRYPTLARLARRFLCLQSTSVASECVFSTAGNILTARRARLHPYNLESLVLIHENYASLKKLYELDKSLINSVHEELKRVQDEKKSE